MDIAGRLLVVCVGLPVDSRLGRRLCHLSLSDTCCWPVCCRQSFPFSLEEIWVVTVVLWLLGYPLYAHIRKREKGRTIIRREIEVLLAVYGWFYLGWGNNYYRQDFFRRSQTERVAYDEQQFRDFLTMYADSLNASYLPSVHFRPIHWSMK